MNIQKSILIPFREKCAKPISRFHQEAEEAGHFRRTKDGLLLWVEPESLDGFLVIHGLRPAAPPKDANQSIWLGKKAIEQAIKGHNVFHAMHRKNVGWVDFLQGLAGNGPPEFEHGAGINHIQAKRDYEHLIHSGNPDGPTVLRALPEVIAKGKVAGHRGLKLELSLGPIHAVIEQVPPTNKNPGEQWLVTGFKRGTHR